MREERNEGKLFAYLVRDSLRYARFDRETLTYKRLLEIARIGSHLCKGALITAQKLPAVDRYLFRISRPCPASFKPFDTVPP